MPFYNQPQIIPPNCVLEIECPNSYYSYPRLTEVENMPAHIRATMNDLWRKSTHQGRTIRAFHYKDVYVAQEGLVFDKSGSMVQESKTYHSDDEIDCALRDIADLQITSDAIMIEKAILVKSRGAENYGHYILEMLPRAWIARKYLRVSDWPALVHENRHPLSDIVTETLQLLGYDEKAIIRSSHKPVVVKELILVDGLTSHTQYMSPFVMNALDDISSCITQAEYSAIYPTRGGNAARDFADESSVSQELSSLGYVKLFTGDMSFKEQVAAFRGTDAVAGVSGAGLSNIAFCRPGTKIHCFMPSGASEVLFWMISERRNLRYHEIRCQEEGPQLGALLWDKKIRAPHSMLRQLVSVNF